MTKRLMSDAEIKHRKKMQGTISRTTSTLGLTGLGVLGGSALVARKPGLARKIPKLKALEPGTIKAKGKSAATNIGIVSGGVGGVGGYNFAAYTNAESRKKTMIQPKKPVKKQWQPVRDTASPEGKRMRRLERYDLGTNLGAAAAGAGGAAMSMRALNHVGRSAKKGLTEAEKAKHLARSYKASKTGVALGAAGYASLGANSAIKNKKDGSWKTYSKRHNVSAFGVVHD